jgi:hypothetical protein
MWRDALVEHLRGRTDVVAAYLFGSQARGTARPESDVDVGIWLPRRPTGLLDGAFDLAGELAALIGKPVDVVVMNSAPSDVVHRILRDGELLLERDRGLRIGFEVRARNDYFDMIPIRDAYRRGPAAKRV